MPRAASVYSDFAVQDTGRRCQNVWISPSGRYCVVCDAFHRVILLDLNSLVVLYLWKGYVTGVSITRSYREVQCLWTEAHVDASDVTVPVLLLFISSLSHKGLSSQQSQNRCFLEAYRVPSVTRVFNQYFPYPFLLLSHLHSRCILDPVEKAILYEKEEEGVRKVHCSLISFQSSSSLLDACSVVDHYHDVQHKNSLLRLLKQCAQLTDPAAIEEIMGIFGIC